MVRQSIAVADARGVEQKGIEDVLVYVGAFIVYEHKDYFKNLFCLFYLEILHVFLPTCLPCVEEVRQRDAQFSGQRQSIPEVPQSPSTVLPADLQTSMLAQGRSNYHKLII